MIVILKQNLVCRILSMYHDKSRYYRIKSVEHNKGRTVSRKPEITAAMVETWLDVTAPAETIAAMLILVAGT